MSLATGASAYSSLFTEGAGALSSAIGAYSSAQSSNYNVGVQQLSAHQRANTADANARLAELNAQMALRDAHADAAAVGLQAGQVMGEQRAAIGANNVAFDSASAMELQASTDLLKDIDLDTIRSNAARTAWGYRTEGAFYETEAENERTYADLLEGGKSNATLAGATSLLGSASSLTQSWYDIWKETK